LLENGVVLSPAQDSRIYHIASPTMPELRFEWHEGVQRVYVIRLAVTPLVGEPFAFDIKDHGAAINATLIWTRGYRAAQMWAPTKEGPTHGAQ
jgi:hypothetical protein